jgi:hypothetical protein
LSFIHFNDQFTSHWMPLCVCRLLLHPSPGHCPFLFILMAIFDGRPSAGQSQPSSTCQPCPIIEPRVVVVAFAFAHQSPRPSADAWADLLLLIQRRLTILWHFWTPQSGLAICAKRRGEGGGENAEVDEQIYSEEADGSEKKRGLLGHLGNWMANGQPAIFGP